LLCFTLQIFSFIQDFMCLGVSKVIINIKYSDMELVVFRSGVNAPESELQVSVDVK